MNLDDWNLVFVSACLVVVLVVCAPVALAYLPRRGEPFMALALLGEEGMAEKYYPDDDPNIEVGERVDWTVYLYNHLGETRLVAVRVKLLDSTVSAPNSTSSTPSPAPVVYEIRRILLDNETWLHPFSWSIVDADGGDFRIVNMLSVNGYDSEVHAVSGDGDSLRMVFELWVYDEGLGEFRFGWGFGDELRCAWNQIWFNATSVQSRASTG